MKTDLSKHTPGPWNFALHSDADMSFPYDIFLGGFITGAAVALGVSCLVGLILRRSQAAPKPRPILDVNKIINTPPKCRFPDRFTYPEFEKEPGAHMRKIVMEKKP